ncbi:Cytoplasmic tRNA 2-thiolation protein 2 [Coemansia sp. RSA 1752]|nr:Cytoplasmic tRNA 2-thiolation protein 2 [Coemansia sp. RSA 1752]
MCDASINDALPPPRRKLVPGMCIKCKVTKPSISIRRTLYCKDCFVKASIVKFRAALTKSRKRIELPQTKVMVALSGGAASSAMLKLTADFMNMERKGTDAEPPFTGVVVGHVDESCLFPGSQEDEICTIAAESGLPYFKVALEDVFAPGEGQLALLELVKASIAPGAALDQFCARLVEPAQTDSHADQLKALFAGLTSATDKEDMLEIVKTALIMRLARNLECGAVLLGDSATRTAVKVMALTGHGRGLSLPLEAGTESQWFHGVVVVRPMRDFVVKEIAFFNRWTRQRAAFVPTFTTGGPRRASIGRLAEAFIVELDRDFPSTVPTVCRTLQKLEPRAEALAARPCVVCGMPAEPDAHAWRSRLTISNAQDTEQLPVPVEASAADSLDITSCLCYSCQNMLHHTTPGTVLPRFCTTQLQNAEDSTASANNHNDLRAKIEEFLIDDSDGSDNEH